MELNRFEFRERHSCKSYLNRAESSARFLKYTLIGRSMAVKRPSKTMNTSAGNATTEIRFSYILEPAYIPPLLLEVPSDVGHYATAKVDVSQKMTY